MCAVGEGETQARSPFMGMYGQGCCSDFGLLSLFRKEAVFIDP